MNREELKDIVISEIQDIVDTGEVTEESNLSDDLGMDSLDYVELICNLERRLNIEIPDDIEGVNTIYDMTVASVIDVVMGSMENKTIG